MIIVGLLVLLGVVCIGFGGYGMYFPIMNDASAADIDMILSMYEWAKYVGDEFSMAEEVAMFALEYRWTFIIVGVLLIVGAIVVKKVRATIEENRYYENIYYKEAGMRGSSEGSMLHNALMQKDPKAAADYWVCKKCGSRIPNKLTVCKYCGQNKYEE